MSTCSTTQNAPSTKKDDTASPEASHTIIEGSTTMRYPTNQASTVFYNPVQVQNRDLSILIITLTTERRAVRKAVEQYGVELKNQKRLQHHLQRANDSTSQEHQQQPKKASQSQQLTFKQQLAVYEQELLPQAEKVLQEQNAQGDNGIDILDALAASGLRSLRYYQEIPGVRHVTINDLDIGAIQRAHDNILVNGLEQHHQAAVVAEAAAEHQQRRAGIRLQVGDAMHELYMSRTPPSPPPASSSTTTAGPTTSDKSKPPSSITYQQQQTQTQWDVIDLDPYGSASPFIDGAVQAIVHGGLLCVTCTDMAALGGSHPETAYGRYHGSMPLQRASYLQEMAVRIVLQTLATSAAKYGRIIHPILSVGMDFYIRIFCTVHDDKAAVSKLSLHIGHVYQSTICQSFFIIPNGQMGGKKGTVYHAGRIHTNAATCTTMDDNNNDNNNSNGGGKTNGDKTTMATPEKADDFVKDGKDETIPKAQQSSNCTGDDHEKVYSKDKIMVDAAGGGTFKIGGPIWLGPMHDKDIVQDALKRLEALPSTPSQKKESSSPCTPSLRFISTRDRLRGLLSNCLEEVPDAPLFYKLCDMAKTLHQSTPPRRDFCVALQNAGYQVSGYHKDPHAIKTNAPDSVVWEIFKTWCRQDQERNPANKKKPLAPGSVAERIMTHQSLNNNNIRVDFTHVRGAAGGGLGRNRGGENDVARFPMNPQAHWGPKKAATGAGAPRNKKRKVPEQEEGRCNDNAKETDS